MRRCSRAFPDDFESWNNLGNVRARARRPRTARSAAFRAGDPAPARHRRDGAQPVRRARPRRAARRAGGGDARGGADRPGRRRGCRPNSAWPRPRRAISRRRARLSARRSGSIPATSPLMLELGLLLEICNRRRRSRRVGRAAAPGGAELGFIKAWALRRQGQFAEALPLAEATPDTINPVRRAQLLAELTTGSASRRAPSPPSPR